MSGQCGLRRHKAGGRHSGIQMEQLGFVEHDLSEVKGLGKLYALGLTRDGSAYPAG